MRAPVSGAAGKAWRTLTAPMRVVAPFALIARRVATGEFWTETKRDLPGSGPKVLMKGESDLQAPRDGAGPLNHRRHSVRIVEPELSAEDLMGSLRTDPNRFSPTSFASFDGEQTGVELVEGNEVTVRLPGPWDGPVVVAESSPTSVRLETRVGHMEAGRIDFSAEAADDDVLTFEIESIARSGDEVFDALYHPAGVGRLVQTEMWVQVLEAAVDVSGGRTQGRVQVETSVYRGAEDA